MHSGKLVFAQVMAHLPLHELRCAVACCRGHHKVKRFKVLGSDSNFRPAIGQCALVNCAISLRDAVVEN